MSVSNVSGLRQAELLSARQQDLRELLEMSEAILEHARQEQWQQALPIQQRRRQAMECFFEQRCSPQEAALVSAVIEEILRLDEQVSDYLHAQRSVLLGEGAERRRNTQQLNRYLQHS